MYCNYEIKEKHHYFSEPLNVLCIIENVIYYYIQHINATISQTMVIMTAITTTTATYLDMTITSFVLDNTDNQVMIIIVQISDPIMVSDLFLPMKKIGQCVLIKLEKQFARITILIIYKT